MFTPRLRSILGALVLTAALAPVAIAQTIDPKSRPKQLVDEALSDAQGELLDMAFTGATAMPANPHIKTRSRFQHDVVRVCLELKQPERALRYADAIDNWRRGEAYAQIAFYCVERGAAAEDVAPMLKVAKRWSTHQMKGTVKQQWRVDRVNVAIAQVHELLGDSARAAKLEKDVVDSQTGKVARVRAMRVTDETFDKQLAILDAEIKDGGFDRARNALEACAELFERTYEDKDRRDKLAYRITNGFEKLPLMVRINLLESLAESSIKREDKDEALLHVAAILDVIEKHRWLVRDELPLLARTARLECRAGAKESAEKRIAGLLERFDEARETIIDIYRAGVLRPIAECYHALGKKGQALRVYKQAIEEGVQNPNSRPRCEDLVRTCCSLARRNVELDAFLRDRLTAVHGALGSPW